MKKGRGLYCMVRLHWYVWYFPVLCICLILSHWCWASFLFTEAEVSSWWQICSLPLSALGSSAWYLTMRLVTIAMSLCHCDGLSISVLASVLTCCRHNDGFIKWTNLFARWWGGFSYDSSNIYKKVLNLFAIEFTPLVIESLAFNLVLEALCFLSFITDSITFQTLSDFNCTQIKHHKICPLCWSNQLVSVFPVLPPLSFDFTNKLFLFPLILVKLQRARFIVVVLSRSLQ